jgi:hypothetical protein
MMSYVRMPTSINAMNSAEVTRWWLDQMSNLANYRPESDSERVQREIKELRSKYRQKRQARSQA